MYSRLHQIFMDQKGGIVFTCLGIWHFLYLLFFVAVTVGVIVWLRNKEQSVKEKAADRIGDIAFWLYVADLFLMPFAYGEIDVDKLPFHACTAMCVMCFCSKRNSFLGRFKLQFVLLGMVSNFMYIVYPSGVASYEIHPFSYRALQTLLFHGMMTIQGVLYLCFYGVGEEWKKWYKDVGVVIVMTVWAFLGNTFYSGSFDDYSHDFNWFFIKADPFGLLPEAVAPYVMPFVMPVVMLIMVALMHCIHFGIRYLVNKRREKNA